MIQLTLDPSAILKEERDRLDALIAAKDWAGILKRFGLRKTGAMAPAAKALEFPSADVYEHAVRTMLKADEDGRKEVLTLFGKLPAALGL